MEKCLETGLSGEWMNATTDDVPVFIRGGSIVTMQFPLLPQGGDVDTLSSILIRKGSQVHALSGKEM